MSSGSVMAGACGTGAFIDNLLMRVTGLLTSPDLSPIDHEFRLMRTKGRESLQQARAEGGCSKALGGHRQGKCNVTADVCASKTSGSH